MAQVLPFRALRYDLDRAGGLSPILSPPYDIISPQGREELYRQSPYNVVRLEFGRPGPGDGPSDNAYTRAAALLDQWLGDGVLSRGDSPAYYAVTEEYGSGGAALTRTGVYGAVRLEEYERGVILPHEQTRPGPKEDRLRLMEACRAVFSPLMSLYRDPGGLRSLLAATMQDHPPQIEAAEGAIRYRLWPIRDPGAVRQVQEAFSNAPVYLGDGHHRYETALTYRNARRAQSGPAAPEQPAYDYALMCLIDMDDPGFQLLSFHRVLHGLTQEQIDRIWDRVRSLFEVAPLGAADSLESALAALQAMDADRPTYGLVDAATGQGYTLSLRDDPLPASSPRPRSPCCPAARPGCSTRPCWTPSSAPRRQSRRRSPSSTASTRSPDSSTPPRPSWSSSCAPWTSDSSSPSSSAASACPPRPPTSAPSCPPASSCTPWTASCRRPLRSFTVPLLLTVRRHRRVLYDPADLFQSINNATQNLLIVNIRLQVNRDPVLCQLKLAEYLLQVDFLRPGELYPQRRLAILPTLIV